MKKIILLLIVFISGIYIAQSQSCIPTTINGSVLNLSCGQPCTSFTYQVPHLRSTTDYLESSTPFAPLPYVVAGGSEDPNLYNDDQFSTLINLPFSFCFYNSNYNSVVVGSNGLITFDATNQGCANAYLISPPIPSNGGGGAQCNQFTSYYPQAAIMAAYYDLDPRTNPPNGTNASPPDRKIQWRVEGTAPCRKFVVSYYHIGVFGNTGPGSCGYDTPNTLQIVIYESTGLIDIYIENKSCTSSTNSNRGILGIQDFTRTLWKAAPGKNATSWNASNEGYRFTPSGGTSNYVSAQIFTMGGTFIATADTATTTAGILDITFPNICPPPGPTIQYVIKTTFNSCTGSPLISSDTITVNRVTTLPATITMTPTTCGTSVGTITVTPTGGTGPYTYILNGGAPVSAPGAYTYSGLPAGPYTVVATDVTGCTNTLNIIVTTTSTIPGTITATPTSCPLSTDGTITVTPTGGTPPYSYSLDGGPSQPGNIFINVAPGPHTVIFTDAMGCTGSVSITVVTGTTPLTANINTTPTSCPTVNNGTITVTPTSGTPAYQYSLDGGPFVPGNIFTNLAAGAHTVTVKDLFGCTGVFNVTVIMGTGLTSTINFTNPPCSNVNNGTITITPTNGTAPYLYSLNGGPVQGSNVFTGLTPGFYTITFTDFIGCSGTNTVTLTTNPPITATSTNVMPLCNGNANGSITINAAGGVAPYQYSINGGVTFQVSPTFTGLAAGTYNFIVKDALGCFYNFTFILTEPGVLTASVLNISATCPNNDGSIDITAGGGTPAYQYSIDGGLSYQPANIFMALPIGNYSIKVKDVNGCIASANTTIILNDTMRLELGPDSTICFGKSLILLPQTNAGTNIFKWIPAAGLDYDTAKNPVASPNDTTRYILTAKWGICQRKDTITINVLHKPIAFAGNDTTICSKTTATLNGSAGNLSGSVNYAWAPPATLTTPNAATTIANPDTSTQYTLTVTDNYGCGFSVSDSMWVYWDPPIRAFAGNDTIAMTRKPHQLFSSGGVSYLWSPAGPLDNPFIQYPKAILTNDTYFTVVVTDAVGCKASDGVFIKVYDGPEYYLPNAFTPNGDGLNDIFRPIPSGMRSTEFFRVFNRNGQMVFQTNRWLEGWDGKLKGKPADQGTYVWYIKGFDVNGKLVEQHGTVILLR